MKNLQPLEAKRPFFSKSTPGLLPRKLHGEVSVQRPRNALTQTIIGAAIEVHRELGPGMLDNAYETCLTFELLRRKLGIERQKLLPLTYKGQLMDCGCRLDLLVEGSVIVEVKSIEKLDRVHFAQVHSYLRFANCPVGLLLNFNVAWLSQGGIRRIVHDVGVRGPLRALSALCWMS